MKNLISLVKFGHVLKFTSMSNSIRVCVREISTSREIGRKQFKNLKVQL